MFESKVPVAHRLKMDETPSVMQKLFKKYGITIEDDGEAIWLYAVNAKATEIFCSALVGNASCLKDKDAFIVHNAYYKCVGLFFDEQFKIVFDFKNNVVASVSENVRCGDNWHSNAAALDDIAACMAP